MAAHRVILVDGSSLIYRAFYALPGTLCTVSGLHTNAIYGFATMFKKLFAGRRPRHGAVVFDAPGKSFRSQKYPQYKAQRPAMPAELAEQLPWIDQLVSANRFPVLRAPGYEADDVIGTLARQASEAGMEVVIVSGDKDLLQLVGARVRVLDTLRDITYDRALVRKKFGVNPEVLADYLAMVGDRADNIPGVPGVGQKGAVGLLAEHGSLAAILDGAAQLAGRYRKAFTDHAATARLCLDLATIDVHVPIEQQVTELIVLPPEPHRLNDLYRELEFYSLLGPELVEGAAAQPGQHRVLGQVSEIGEFLAGLDREAAVAVVPAHSSATVVRSVLAGFSLCSEPGRTVYVPISGPGGLGKAGLDALKRFFEDASQRKVTHDYKAMRTLLGRGGIELRGLIGDVMLASFLIDSGAASPHDIDSITREYLHRTLPPRTALVGGGRERKSIVSVPAEEIGLWLGQRVSAICELWPILHRTLEERSLTGYLRDIDLPVSEVLADMELAGIVVDRRDLEAMDGEFRVRRDQLEADIHALAGQTFNVGSPKQLSEILFDKLGLPVIKKNKSGYSTRSEVLEQLRPKHPIAGAVLDYRRFAKLIDTYTEVLMRAARPDSGRIHTTFLQTFTATGRIISTEPNLQRTPTRSAEGKRVRRAFIAAPGHALISADWNQIELRILAHVSGDSALIDAFAGGLDVHCLTAVQLFGTDYDDISAEQRDIAKTINFATIYGQGATALAQTLGIARKQAKNYIENYFSAYRGVRAWLDRTIAEAHQKGHVETLLGRRRTIPELSSSQHRIRQIGERMAVNTPIQGTGADICKLAMIAIHRELEQAGLDARLLLQIHDELLLEAPQSEVARVCQLVEHHMEHCISLAVPLVVNIGVGKNWAEAH
ncbi:MAG: DNA polymerase I [Proteobacteria bacterium]|nr:DNA polymerase I [Pseudomonadota bacterium]